MPTRTATLRRFPIFLCVVTGVYATALALAGRLSTMEGAGTLAVGLTLDIVVLVPLAYYFLVVRPRGLPIVMLAPILLISLVAAYRVIPPEHHRPLEAIEFLLVPVEFALIGSIVWRVNRAVRTARRDMSADPIEQFRRAAFDILKTERVAGIFASEIAVFYYALGSWRAEPHVPAGMSAFTHHEKSGHGGIVFGFLVLLLIEGFAVHMLLSSWSPVAAWIFTLSTAYAALWMIADYRATVLRPVLVDDDAVFIRAGLRHTLLVPRSKIESIRNDEPEFGKMSKNFTLLGSPTIWIAFSEPLSAQGFYGFSRSVRAVGLDVDEAQRFERRISTEPE